MLALFATLVLQIPHLSIGPADLDCQPLTKYPHVRVYPPRESRTWITLYSGQTVPPAGTYALGSKSLMLDPDGWKRSPWGQLVTIQTWVGNKGYFPHGEFLQTKWDGKAAILATVPITKDVKLDGVKGTMHLAFVDGAEIENVEVPAGWDAGGLRRAISIQFCRNVQMRMVRVGASINAGPGEAYAVQSQRSIGTNVSGLYVDGVRHGFTLFGGTGFVGGLFATNPKGTQIDAHGFGGKLYASGCYLGGSNIAVGNKYPLGDEAELSDIHQAAMLWLHGPSRVKVYDSKFSGPLGLERNQYGEPLSVYAERCTFTAYSNWPAIHKASADLTIVPELVNVVLKAFTPN